MPNSNFDVIVIGMGAMGAAAAAELARRGARVLGLDRFSIPNTMNTHHGGSRAIRVCYFEDPNYVPLLQRAYELWRELEDEGHQPLMHITGGVWFGPPDCSLVADSRRAAELHGLDYDWVDAPDLSTRFPDFRLPPDHVAFCEPDAGLLLPEACVAAFASRALNHGATLREFEPVRGWSEQADHLSVTTDHATYEAAHVVFTAGIGSPDVLDLGDLLTVTRQELVWVTPAKPQRFVLGRLPVWSMDRAAGGVYYGFPMIGDRPGMKLAIHRAGPRVHPDDVDRTRRPDDWPELSAMLRERMPDAAGDLLAASTCFYTNSPDEHFIVDRHPQCDRATIATGFSGHGFKFASVMGEVLADLALTGTTAHSIEFLRLARFQR